MPDSSLLITGRGGLNWSFWSVSVVGSSPLTCTCRAELVGGYKLCATQIRFSARGVQMMEYYAAHADVPGVRQISDAISASLY